MGMGKCKEICGARPIGVIAFSRFQEFVLCGNRFGSCDIAGNVWRAPQTHVFICHTYGWVLLVKVLGTVLMLAGCTPRCDAASYNYPGSCGKIAMSREKIQTVAVVGAGISGVVAASHLLKYGLQVTVFERSSGPGGVW